MISTQWFIGDGELTDAHKLRRAVFIEEQGIACGQEFDGTDAACLHLVAYVEDAPVATGRVLVALDEFLIGRVAVLPAFRGQQLGGLVVRTLIRACFLMGGERQTVHAQVQARKFYEGLGFTVCGDVYEEAGIPHITMEHIGDCETACQGKCR